MAALNPDAAHIAIDLHAQEISLLGAGNREVVWSQISSGRSDTPTPVGKFNVLEKHPTKFSNLYGKWVNRETREVVVSRIWEHDGPQPPGTEYQGYQMDSWLRVTWDGIGIHRGEFKPGELSSKGCIRVPEEPQSAIWQHVRLGTPITISGDASGHPDAP